MKLFLNYLVFITSFSFGNAQVAEHFKTNDFEVAIFPKEYKIYHSEKRFTPTKEEIRLAENALKFKMKELFGKDSKEKIYKNLKKYKRQYFGFFDENRNRILLINAFCNEKHNWTEEIIQVNDGGSCYWEIKFDISKNELTDLYINGEA